MKVIAISKVRVYLKNLAVTLYENEYFGFEETARNYVIELFNDIITTLPTRPSKPAPKYFEKYGKDMRYATFRKSKNTQWYVFFRMYKEKGEIIYQIRYIGNNHVIAQYL